MVVSRIRLATLAVTALAVAACSKKDNYAVTDTTAASSTMSADTSAMAANTSSNWTDANIFALLDEANAADSTAGSVAATKGTSSAVRDFGKRMMRDHHQLRVQGAALAKKLNITQAAPSDDPVTPAAQKEMDTLNSTAKGKDFATSLGPVVVTPDELGDLRLEMVARVNGEERSRGNLGDMYHSWESIVAHAARNTELRPGDILGSGTVGTACILEHGDERWLQPGDEVELEVQGIGLLKNRIR